jgi:hypothetical protein
MTKKIDGKNITMTTLKNLKKKEEIDIKKLRKTGYPWRIINHIRSRHIKYSKKHISYQGILKLIGCSPIKLKEYLESKFTKNMNWENYGLRGWHIDHIKPISLGKKDLNILNKLTHYTNLQPLWSKDNWIKNAKICENVIIQL